MWIPLTFHWHAIYLYKYINIHTQTHVPQWLPPYTQYTHHNDLARPTPCWSIYLLHSNLPLGFDSSSFMPLWHCRGTTPCLSAHLSVHLSPCPSVCPACQQVVWLNRESERWSWVTAWNGVKGNFRSKQQWIFSCCCCFLPGGVKLSKCWHVVKTF